MYIFKLCLKILTIVIIVSMISTILMRILRPVFFSGYAAQGESLITVFSFSLACTLPAIIVYLVAKSSFKNWAFYLQGIVCFAVAMSIVLFICLTTFGIDLGGMIYTVLSVGTVCFVIPYLDMVLNQLIYPVI
jgi:hypothetical protein